MLAVARVCRWSWPVRARTNPLLLRCGRLEVLPL
jgi:hypothetical protein